MSQLLVPNGEGQYTQSATTTPRPERKRVTRADTGEVVLTAEERELLEVDAPETEEYEEPEAELLPSELAQIQERFAAIQGRFTGKNAKLDLSGCIDAMEHALLSMGLQGEVGGTLVRHKSGGIAFSPSINRITRVGNAETDHDEIAYEVQHGLADGVVGVMKNGRLAEPKKLL